MRTTERKRKQGKGILRVIMMVHIEKVTFEEKSGRGKGASVMDIWAKSIPYSGNSWCKFPKECECV